MTALYGLFAEADLRRKDKGKTPLNYPKVDQRGRNREEADPHPRRIRRRKRRPDWV